MIRISPFQGLRPADSLAHLVASVPYDVVNSQEAAELAADNPHSLLHIDRAEIDMPAGTDMYSDAVYAKAAENLKKFQENGTLVRESAPCVYVYRQEMDGHVQTGIALVCHIEDYENDIIKKHEKTRPDKEDDRTRLIDALSADTSPVFLTYKDQPTVDVEVERITAGEPLFHFVAADNVEHWVWKVEDSDTLLEGFYDVDVSYVADGHHRTASAARVGRERREANPDHTGHEAYNGFLAVLFPATQLKVLPYNRTVQDLNGKSPEEFLATVREVFEVTENADPSPAKTGDISMYLGGKWYGLHWQPAADEAPADRLDVAGLQDRLLAPILGIDDPRTSKRISFVGGIRGTQALAGAVDSGDAAVAFSMFPTSVEELMDIADAGQIMPPKSTWFEPKLRSGLFIHTLD